MESTAVVGRLAPSPTGRLHLGHARSFLAAWCSARAAGGRVLLRVEDLDANRARAQYVAGVLEDLEWLGLEHSGPVLYQSERREAHREALEALIAQGRAYACHCTRREILAAASAPHAGSGEVPYPGTCRAGRAARGTGESAWRFALDGPGHVRFVDRLSGAQQQNVAQQVGDFVIWTKADVAAYQLAVVVDDAYQGVTEVLRGDDLLPSVGRQALLQEALGLPRPTWLHLPLVEDLDGRRLAKRAGDRSLLALREAGVEAGSVLRWAATSLGMQGDGNCPADFVGQWQLSRIPRDPVQAPSAWG